MWALGSMTTRYRITKETLKTLVQGTGGEIYRLERKIYKRRKLEQVDITWRDIHAPQLL